MKIAIIGLGYVGLPLALGMARAFEGAVGFDIHEAKILALRDGHDPTGEISSEALLDSSLHMTSDIEDLRSCTFYIVAVPTPIDEHKAPDLTPVIRASETVGKVLKKGDIVVYESTVYPGVTEGVCADTLLRLSGLSRGDFRLGYSPERINPGDKEHTLERIVKVVSAEDTETLATVAEVYGAVIKAGVHQAPSIMVAEAAKVIENTQRDINIALMNELSLIFDRMGIRTADVLAAARTKWNFLPFTPGLVGGHCIGVDPYYLTTKAQLLGYHPEVILAGRRINDGMGAMIAQKLIKLLVHADIPPKCAKVGILGLTFKENVTDLRNSRVPDIIQELRQFGIEPLVHDAVASAHEAKEEYGLEVSGLDAFQALDGLILAVSHRAYLEVGPKALATRLRPGGIFLDVKSAFAPGDFPPCTTYWSL
ncbi:nucleotide sugar dehydrogenase [Geothrix oryzisoli]|uniref:nucleotide sugar dehydrogenase n=1 Tax=Geothrix oryzisoli TaxID=2922721 RepID=UPI001FAC3190|nr:nucleotide sugar dehydrogenase [Geothrix oryzisoli]